jgi:putative redox protein
MEVKIQHLGDVSFEASARGHRVICDQPRTNGGSDSGMTPPEFLLASLGTCAGFYAVQYLKTRSLPADGLEVTVTAEKATQPARLGQFRIAVAIPELDPRHEEGVLRAVKACLIHNTLVNAPAIEIAVQHDTIGVGPTRGQATRV